MVSVFAPAVAAAWKIWSMSSSGVLEPSLRTKSMVAPCFLAYSMLSMVCLSACSLDCLSLCWRLSPLNAVSMDIDFTPLSKQASMLDFVGSAEAVRAAFSKVSFTIRLTLRLSSSEKLGNPTLMTAMPVSSISLASLTCST